MKKKDKSGPRESMGARLKRYIFNIKQNFNGRVDGQNVWTVARTKEEACRDIESEYHNLADIHIKPT